MKNHMKLFEQFVDTLNMDYSEEQEFYALITDYACARLEESHSTTEARALYKQAQRTLSALPCGEPYPCASRLSTVASREYNANVSTACCMWVLIDRAVRLAHEHFLQSLLQDRHLLRADLQRFELPARGIDNCAPDGIDESRNIISRVYELCFELIEKRRQIDVLDDKGERDEVIRSNSNHLHRQLYQELHTTEEFKTWRQRFPFFKRMTVDPMTFWETV